MDAAPQDSTAQSGAQPGLEPQSHPQPPSAPDSHQPDVIVIPDSPPRSPTGPFCAKCNKSFNTHVAAYFHECRFHLEQSVVKCPDQGCSLVFVQPRALFAHWNVMHNGSYLHYACVVPECTRGFEHHEDFMQHLVNHHNINISLDNPRNKPEVARRYFDFQDWFRARKYPVPDMSYINSVWPPPPQPPSHAFRDQQLVIDQDLQETQKMALGKAPAPVRERSVPRVTNFPSQQAPHRSVPPVTNFPSQQGPPAVTATAAPLPPPALPPPRTRPYKKRQPQASQQPLDISRNSGTNGTHQTPGQLALIHQFLGSYQPPTATPAPLSLPALPPPTNNGWQPQRSQQQLELPSNNGAHQPQGQLAVIHQLLESYTLPLWIQTQHPRPLRSFQHPPYPNIDPGSNQPTAGSVDFQPREAARAVPSLSLEVFGTGEAVDPLSQALYRGEVLGFPPQVSNPQQQVLNPGQPSAAPAYDIPFPVPKSLEPFRGHISAWRPAVQQSEEMSDKELTRDQAPSPAESSLSELPATPSDSASDNGQEGDQPHASSTAYSKPRSLSMGENIVVASPAWTRTMPRPTTDSPPGSATSGEAQPAILGARRPMPATLPPHQDEIEMVQDATEGVTDRRSDMADDTLVEEADSPLHSVADTPAADVEDEERLEPALKKRRMASPISEGPYTRTDEHSSSPALDGAAPGPNDEHASMASPVPSSIVPPMKRPRGRTRKDGSWPRPSTASPITRPVGRPRKDGIVPPPPSKEDRIATNQQSWLKLSNWDKESSNIRTAIHLQQSWNKIDNATIWHHLTDSAPRTQPDNDEIVAIGSELRRWEEGPQKDVGKKKLGGYMRLCLKKYIENYPSRIFVEPLQWLWYCTLPEMAKLIAGDPMNDQKKWVKYKTPICIKGVMRGLKTFGDGEKLQATSSTGMDVD